MLCFISRLDATDNLQAMTSGMAGTARDTSEPAEPGSSRFELPVILSKAKDLTRRQREILRFAQNDKKGRYTWSRTP